MYEIKVLSVSYYRKIKYEYCTCRYFAENSNFFIIISLLILLLQTLKIIAVFDIARPDEYLDVSAYQCIRSQYYHDDIKEAREKRKLYF